MRVALALAAACLAGGEAVAGAWTLAEGRGQIIMSAGRKLAPIGAFAGGTASADSNSSQIFVEYGLFDGWTIGATAFADVSTTSGELELRIGGHVRHRVWTGGAGDVVSLQAGYSGPVEGWLGSGLGDHRPNSVPEAHFRVLYGRGWQTGWGNSFVSAETGPQIRGERQDEEWRFDVTAGHRPTRRLMGLFSVFTTVPFGDQGEASLKLAPSLAYTLWPFIGPNEKKPDGPIHPSTIQLGIVYDLLNTDDGLGVSVSIWRSF